MKSTLAFVVSVLAVTPVLAQSESAAPIAPAQRVRVSSVKTLDLKRFVGRWYEVAGIPQKHTRACHCATLDYSLLPDGSLKIVNTCRLNNPAGELVVTEGRATVQDETNAKLRVNYVLSWFPGFRRLFSSDSWVTSVSPDYTSAVVSNPKGSTMAILSRAPQLEEKTFQRLVSVSQSSMNVAKLKYQNQRGCAYP